MEPTTTANSPDGFVAIGWLIGFIIFLTIAILKRKWQVGRRWDHPFSARVKINDIQLACHHCKEEHFYKREALMGSTLVTLFGFHFLNENGTAYKCAKCKHIHWFSKPKETDVEFFREKE